MMLNGVAATMVTPEILPVWKHVDGVIIAKMELRVAMSTRMLYLGGGDK